MTTRGVKKRNVVVLGKTGAGKSTVANKIVQLGVSAAEQFDVSAKALKSVTRETAIRSIELEYEATKYQIKIIDTVGLFDTGAKSNEEAKRENDKNLDELKNFFEKNIPEGLSLVLFVSQHGGRWTAEEQATYDCIVKNLREDISPISALVITRCDGLTEDEVKRVVTEYEVDKKEVFTFMQKGIHPVAFPDVSKMRTALRDAFEMEAKEYQNALRDLICKKCDEMRLKTKAEREEAAKKAKKGFCTIL